MAFPIIPIKRSGAAGNPSSLNLGELAVNTLTGELFLGADAGVTLLNGPVSAGTTVTEATGDGTTTAFAFAGYNGIADGGYIVSVGGIDQPPSTYSISATAGGTITFSSAPTAGELISIRAIVAGSGGGSGGTDIGGRAWSNTATYSEGDLVATSQAETWICIQNSNTGNDPATSPTWWDKMPANAVTLQGSAVSATAPTTSGQVLAWNGTAWAPTTPNAGTVTSITAGTGLTGGTITDSGTIAVDYGQGAGQACGGDDYRLSNDRAPLAHKNTHAIAGTDFLSPDDIGAASKFRQIIAGIGLTGGGTLTADRTLTVSYGTTAGTSAQGNDTRLSDARTPTAHKSTHATGGTDALSPADIGAEPAITTLAVAKGGTGAVTLTGLVKGTGTTAMVAATAGTDYVVPSGNITGTAANVTGTDAVANGGSGQTSFTNGQLLIGNTTGNTLTKATLTAGNGIIMTNGAGAITIATTGSYLADALIVAGGGGGGTWTGGGGGAGGLQSKTAVSLIPGTNYPIVIGSGGAGSVARANTGTVGNATTALGFTSLGGGGGGSLPATGALAGTSGGSGGGGAGSPTTAGAGGAGTSGQGLNGGNGATASPYGGGGGGGSSAVGGIQSGTVAGAGGAGTSSSITGSAITYAGGGGGCPTSGGAYTGGAGGAGGGGAGGNAGTVGTAGTVNTGGGGGGGSNASSAEAAGGAGGSGIVILSVPTANYSGTVTGSPTVTTSGSNTIIKFAASGSYTA